MACKGLTNKKKPGNPLSKYCNKKNLTKEEQLEYENMKLKIENELLKKGYLMKGDGTPTDNPVIESKNGWIKKEMHIDFDKNNYNTVQEFVGDIVKDNNCFRPSYALNYKTPIEYKTQLGFK